jgi:hypothetical protein
VCRLGEVRIVEFGDLKVEGQNRELECVCKSLTATRGEGTHLFRLLIRRVEQIACPSLRDDVQEVKDVVDSCDKRQEVEWQWLVWYNEGHVMILLERPPVGQREGRGNGKAVLTRIGSASSNAFRTAVSSSNIFVPMRCSLRAFEAGWFQEAQMW